MGDCVFGILVGDTHFLSVGGAPAYRGVHNAALLFELTADNGSVFTVERVLLYLLSKRGMSRIGLGNEQQPARILINAVDNAGADNAVYPRKVALAMPQKCVDEGALIVTRRGVNDHALRLIDHEQVAVLIHYIKRDILCPDRKLLRLGHGEADDIALPRLMILLNLSAVAHHKSVGKQPLHKRTGILAESLRQSFIKPNKVIARLDGKADRLAVFD